jgi:AmmeMemoRadiSam system protein A
MISYAALTPHPPILIPEIGGERLKEARDSRAGMQAMARQLVESCPESLVFLTPHGNVFADAISALGERTLQGDFANFGVHVPVTTVKNDRELLAGIEKGARQAGIPFLSIDEELARHNHLQSRLDHGILVPLHYLQEAGLPDMPIVAISIGYLSITELYGFGTLIRQAAQKLGRNIAVIASGDMSHRLKDEGPYDYHPDGERFDHQMRDLIAAGDTLSLLEIPEDLRNNAGECGYRSVVILLGTLDGLHFSPQVFSYEGPFGVGYLVAGFTPGEEKPGLWEELITRQRSEIEERRRQETPPVRWARLTLENYIRTGVRPELPAEMEELRSQRAGTFVSLKKNGQLRGCIGTIAPFYGDLAEEIARNAVSAGTEDPRFMPVEEGELNDLVYSVDILGEPEPATREQLDPGKYGVIVSQGRRRGLLLPDLEGVDTVEEQLVIALQKAGIKPSEDYQIQRFQVKRFT